MKVKFIKENPDWSSIGMTYLEDYPELGCIYDAEYEPDGFFGGTDYTDSYQIGIYSIPAPWFEAVEYQSPLQPSEWTNVSDTSFNN